MMKSNETVVEGFIDELDSLCSSIGVRITEWPDDDYTKLRLEFGENFPLWMTVELHPELGSAIFYGVVRTYGLPGDRSDYHDLISSIWAIGLRSLNVASVRLVDIPHPAVEGELYGRYLLFDAPPCIGYLNIEKAELDKIREILTASRFCTFLLSDIFQALGCDHDKERYDGSGGSEWASAVASTLRLKVRHDDSNYSRRIKPNWLYYRRNDRGITAFKFETSLSPFFPKKLPENAKVFDGADGYLVTSGSINNTLPTKMIDTLSILLKLYSERFPAKITNLRPTSTVLLVPIESHIFLLTCSGIIALEGDCGQRAFIEGRYATRLKHQELAKFLYNSVEFEWRSKIDDERFELLILELLQRERGIEWVRKVGHSTAADGERDIVAEWFLGPAPWQEAGQDRPIVKRRVIVQCKAYKEAINLSKLPNIPVILDFHNADGYLLVAFPRITPQVVDYFKTVPSRQKFWSDWWTKPEIEERLRANLDIARRYSDLFLISDESTAPPAGKGVKD